MKIQKIMRKLSLVSQSRVEITWNRFVRTHNSSSPSVLRLIFIPLANCSFSSSFTTVLKAPRPYGRFVVSQHAISFKLSSPKNKFSLESMAVAADWVPLRPSTWNASAYAFLLFSQAARSLRTSRGTEFSVCAARAWKYNERLGRVFLSIARPKIP